jgi:protein O-GlcNAc transferase
MMYHTGQTAPEQGADVQINGLEVASGIIALPEALRRAIIAYNNGRSSEAERLCRAIITAKPDVFEALYLLAIVQTTLGRTHEALTSYARALAIRPDHFETLGNRSALLQELKRLDEALASWDKTLAVKPDDVVALTNRGSVLLLLKRYNEALASYEKTIALNPDCTDALYFRGIVLQQLKRFGDALASYEGALAVRPKHPAALENRGTVLLQLKRFADALASYEEALALQPNDAAMLNNRGVALQELRRFEEALSSFDRAVAVKPDNADALSNRGLLLHQQGRFGRAVTDFARALAINAELPYAKGWLLFSRMNCCQWGPFASETDGLLADVRAGKRACYPFVLLSLSASTDEQLSCSETYARDTRPTTSAPIWKGKRYCHDRIRVAYLSADFRDHPVCRLLAGVFEQHDHARFETIAISFGPGDLSEMRPRVERAFDRFIDVGNKNDRDVAGLLGALEIDIAVDLMGFTRDNRCGIFALRAAPIQLNCLGYPGTMGADHIDYIIADRIVIPDSHFRHYREKVVWLPDTFQANDSMRRMGEPATRAAVGLPETAFVFCSFSNTYKITPAIFDVWMRLLRCVEGSVLWLLGGRATVERNLRREAEIRGISPDRLVFAARVEYSAYLSQYTLADLFLDTFPFNAGATASDALWAGLPLVTCSGEAFASRMAASLLHAVGLPELIAPSLDRYETLALELARNEGLLTAVRTKLARHRDTCPLFDTDRFRRQIEAAYITMWERYQRGEPPASFAVPMPAMRA